MQTKRPDPFSAPYLPRPSLPKRNTDQQMPRPSDSHAPLPHSLLPPYAGEWMAQWRSAADELAKIRITELRELTDEQALERSISLVPVKPFPLRPASGLVELQRILRKQQVAQNE